MRRIFKIIFSSIFILLFFIVLSIFVNIDNENFYTHFGFTQKYNNFNVSFRTLPNNNQKIEIINKIQDLSENKFSIIVNDYINENEKLKKINLYVCAKDEFIKEMIPGKINSVENFSNGERYFSTNLKQDKNNISLFSFYNEVEYNMYPFNKIKNDVDILKYDFSVYYSKDLDKKYVEELLNKEFLEYDVSITEMGAEKYDKISDAKNKISYISVVTLIISILFILFNVSYHLKTVSVLKLNGFKNIDIVKYIFGKDILFTFILSLVIPILFTILFIGKFDIRVIEFLIVTIAISILMFLLFITITFLSNIIIDRYSLSDFIKNKNINNLLANVTYLLLIVSTIIILPLIKENVSNIIESTNKYLQLVKESKDLENISKINVVNDTKRQWEFNVFDYYEKKENVINEKIIKVYEDLDNMNVLYRFNDIVLSPNFDNLETENQKSFLAHEINRKYLNETSFYNNGEKIYVQNDEDLNVFMDEKTFNNYKWEKEDFVNFEIKTKIYIFDTVNYKKISESRVEDFDNEEYPIFLYTNNNQIFVKDLTLSGIYIDNEQKNEIEDYLIKNKYNKNIQLSAVNDRLQLYKPYLYKSLRNDLISLLPGLISLIAIFVSFTNFYILANKKETAIYKSLGYKYLSIVKSFIVEISFVIFIYLIFAYFIQKDVRKSTLILLLFISFSMICYYIYTIKNTKIKKI